MPERRLLSLFAHPDDESRIVGGALNLPRLLALPHIRCSSRARLTFTHLTVW